MPSSSNLAAAFLGLCAFALSPELTSAEPLPLAKVTVALGRSWSHKGAAAAKGVPDEILPGLTAPDVDVSISAHAGHKVPQVILRSNSKHLLNVTLPGNPTTGFSWSILPEHDSNVVTQIKTPSGEGYEYERSSNLIGAGGLFKFTFAAKNPGTTKLTFFYGRPWEHNTVVDETSAVDVPVLVV